MTLRYFVTGGAGFIGSHMVDRLLAEGSEVTVYDNLSLGRTQFIENHFDNPRFRFIEDDLLNFETLKSSMVDHDFVFHLAANSDVRVSNILPEVDLKQGTIATFNVLEAMRNASVRKIVFSSSSVVYGEPETIPTPERYGPLKPISLYGASKLASEGLITAYCHTFDMFSWVFRFANIVGRRGTHGVLIDFINKLKKNDRELEVLGDGKQKKSYLLVEECIDAILFVIKNSSEKANIFNIGYNDSVEVSTIAKILTEKMGLKKVRFVYTDSDRGWAGDVPRMTLDTRKINKLGWVAKNNSEQAIKKAVEELIRENL